MAEKTETRAKGGSSKGFTLSMVAGLLVIPLSAVAAIAWTARSRPAGANDYGFAVLVTGGAQAELGDGSIQTIANLATIPVSSVVTALTEARLSLQSTFEAGSDLGEGTLYLGPDTQIELVALDPRIAVSGSDPVIQTGPTELRLDQGKLLVLRANGTREYQVHGQGVSASLSGAGRGAMGVEASGGELLMACLMGACRMTASGGQDQLLQAGESILAVGGSPRAITSIPTGARASWVELCDGCLAGG